MKLTITYRLERPYADVLEERSAQSGQSLSLISRHVMERAIERQLPNELAAAAKRLDEDRAAALARIDAHLAVRREQDGDAK